MNYLLKNSFLAILLFGFSQCSKDNNVGTEYDLVIYRIPESDKFIFGEGDSLKYNCNDGTYETIYVLSATYDFESLTFNSANIDFGFGGEEEKITTFSYETFEIILESPDDRWKRYLEVEAAYGPCYRIFFKASPVDTLNSHIFKDCHERASSRSIASGKEDQSGSNSRDYIQDTIFNETVFSNLHSYNLSNGCKIFWNLKYGIIRFESKYETSELSWDLLVNN